MKVYKVNRGTAPLILKLGTWCEMSRSRLGRFTPGERTTVATELEAALLPDPAWTFLRERKMFCSCRDSKPGLSNPQYSHYTGYVTRLTWTNPKASCAKPKGHHKGIQRAPHASSRIACLHFTKYFFLLGFWSSERRELLWTRKSYVPT